MDDLEHEQSPYKSTDNKKKNNIITKTNAVLRFDNILQIHLKNVRKYAVFYKK